MITSRLLCFPEEQVMTDLFFPESQLLVTTMRPEDHINTGYVALLRLASAALRKLRPETS